MRMHCAVACVGEARSSVLAFWHKFVEPYFGRGQRQYAPLHTKMEMQQLEAEEHMEKQSSSSSEEPEEPKGKWQRLNFALEHVAVSGMDRLYTAVVYS